MANVKRFPWLALVGTTICFVMSGCYSHNTDGSDSDSNSDVVASGSDPLLGEIYPRTNMRNPYGHIPAQCYIETSGGTQNACLFCHTNGVFLQRLGNNNPQAGYEPLVGNLQLTYALAGAARYRQVVSTQRYDLGKDVFEATAFT